MEDIGFQTDSHHELEGGSNIVCTERNIHGKGNISAPCLLCRQHKGQTFHSFFEILIPFMFIVKIQPILWIIEVESLFLFIWFISKLYSSQDHDVHDVHVCINAIISQPAFCSMSAELEKCRKESYLLRTSCFLLLIEGWWQDRSLDR